MDIRLNTLNKTIVNCKRCPRLVKFVNKISKKKRKQNINEVYWGKPVPGFGSLDSKLAIIGLAPAAHGGTRTGRAFTGDRSGDFLFKCLHEVGISNSPISKDINDNLNLKSTYITNILKCVPPEDKPLSDEISNCSNFFNKEIFSLLAAKYNNKSVVLLNVDLLSKINFLILSEFFDPPGSLILMNFLLFFFKYFSTFFI